MQILLQSVTCWGDNTSVASCWLLQRCAALTARLVSSTSSETVFRLEMLWACAWLQLTASTEISFQRQVLVFSVIILIISIIIPIALLGSLLKRFLYTKED